MFKQVGIELPSQVWAREPTELFLLVIPWFWCQTVTPFTCQCPHWITPKFHDVCEHRWPLMAAAVAAHRSRRDRGKGDMEFCAAIKIWGGGMERDRVSPCSLVCLWDLWFSCLSLSSAGVKSTYHMPV